MSEQTPFVITISRQLGSGGSYLGQRVAARLGIHYADREIVRQAAIMLHVSEEAVEPMDEKITPVWQSLLRTFDHGRPELSYMPPANLPPLDDEFHLAQSTVITQIAESCSAVIVGRGGYHLLRDNPRHLAVFLYADADFRLRRIQEIYDVSADKATKLMETSDHDRRRYLHNVMGSDWTDALQYHLSLDTSALGFTLAEETIVHCLLARLEVVST
jgi:cytidylate kinase